MLITALERESSSVVGRFSKIDVFVSRYESRPTDALFAPVLNPDESGPVPLVSERTIYRDGAQCVSQRRSNPSLKAPEGRYVYRKHGKTNPKAPEGRHVGLYAIITQIA